MEGKERERKIDIVQEGVRRWGKGGRESRNTCKYKQWGRER